MAQDQVENFDDSSIEFSEALQKAKTQEKGFSDDHIYELAKLVVLFGEQMAGILLYEYQRQAATGIVFSMLREDGEELTMLFARQSGKTEVMSVVSVGMITLLPILAKNMPQEPRLSKFKRGVWVGIFGPTTDVANIMYSRMQARLYSDAAAEILSDPEIDLTLPMRGQGVWLSNGSYVDCNTAASGAKIEGKTYHLIILEECITGDTLVALADGTQKRVDELVKRREPTEVLSYDGTRIVSRKLNGWWRREERELVELRVGGQRLRCTPEHRVFTQELGWVHAKDSEGLTLTLNESVPLRPATGKVEEVVVLEEKEVVYDLGVEDTHCFFANGMLVHNCQDIDDYKIKKCLSGDTTVYSSVGRYAMRELVPSMVPLPQVTMDGDPAVQTSWEFHDNGMQRMSRVHTANGRYLDATAKHRWFVRRRDENDRKPFITTTDKLRVGDTVAVPERWETEELGDATYGRGLVLGAMLGDSCLRQTMQFCGFRELVASVAAATEEEFGVKWHEYKTNESGLVEGAFARDGGYRNPMTDWFRELGLYGKLGRDKFLPESCFVESWEFKRGVVVGLVETDGSIVGGQKPHISFDSTSKKLAEDYRDLLWQFGIHTTFHTRTNNGTFRRGREIHCVRVSGLQDIARFRREFKLIAKQAALDAIVTESKYSRHGTGRGVPNGMRFVRIQAIDDVGVSDTYCLSIENQTFLANGLLSLNSIHPMGAATSATMVKIGTPVPRKCDFEQSCLRNRRRDLESKGKQFKEVRLHYEFDYTVAIQYNARYAKYIRREVERLGEDSDEFRMSYKLHWLTERGRLISPELFDTCSIVERQEMSEWVRDAAARKGKTKTKFVRPSYPTTNDSSSEAQVAGIDFGKSDASTVVTIARVWWDNPLVLHGPDDEELDRFYVHVQNWLELSGDDYVAQVPQIVSFLQNFKVGLVVCDSTGPGDPVTSFLADALDTMDVTVEPFIFSAQSKDIGYKLLLQEMKQGRFTFPAGKRATRTRKWKRFRQQMIDLEKRYRGARMVVEKPNEPGAHDDYPDSAMMVVYGVVNYADMHKEIEIDSNPFVGRQARKDLTMFGRAPRRVRNARMQDKLSWENDILTRQNVRFRRG